VLFQHLLELLSDKFFSICASVIDPFAVPNGLSAHPMSCCHWTFLTAVFTGEDLLVASADKPFRFPATFTFVVRSFTVLDGIGKGLDPRFDISEIAAPYARGLLLEGNPQYAALAKDFKRRLGVQVSYKTHQTG